MIDDDTLRWAVALDRERIARDLHDNAIQRLYAMGLQLQGSLGRQDLVHQVGRAIDSLDEVIREIRATIFGMRAPRTLLEGPTQAIRAAIAEAGRVLADPPDLRIDGALDDVPADIASDVVSTCRELLSNVVRHSRAARCWVHLDITADDLTLTVDDDGVGCPTATIGGLGVANVRERAVARSGRCTWSARHPVGTTVTWWIPVGEPTGTADLGAVNRPLPGFEIDDAA